MNRHDNWAVIRCHAEFSDRAEYQSACVIHRSAIARADRRIVPTFNRSQLSARAISQFRENNRSLRQHFSPRPGNLSLWDSNDPLPLLMLVVHFHLPKYSHAKDAIRIGQRFYYFEVVVILSNNQLDGFAGISNRAGKIR